jgi:hypothetical protein
MAQLAQKPSHKVDNDLRAEDLPLQMFVAYLCGVRMLSSTNLAGGVDET